MLLQRLFAARPGQDAGRALYAAAAGQARRPELYRVLGAVDTVEGRFELYSLHVALILIRLRGQGQIAAAVAQHLFDAYVRALDDALRDLGVSDVKVGAKMRKLGEAFYGRLKAYEEAIGRLPADAELKALLQRTALDHSQAGAEALTAYVVRAAAALNAQPLEDFLEGQIVWPEAASHG